MTGLNMKGIMFVSRGQAALIDEPMPECAPGTLLCQTVFSGLTNGTERNTLMGGNYARGWPGRAAYQNVGRVLEVGDGVSGYAPGDLVFSGDFQQHRQFFAAPAGPADLLIKLPESVNPRDAALFGVASVAVHDVQRAAARLGERVLVIGAGPIGLFTSQAARLAGAFVTVCDLNERRLALARSLGAHGTVVPDADWANVKALGPFDCVIEDSGAPVLDYVIGATWDGGLLRSGSRVVMIAGRGRVDYNFNAAQGYELSVIHASHFVKDDLQLACTLNGQGVYQIAPVIQDVVPWKDMVALYGRLRDDSGSLMGVVFDWR
jgi:2-desacetyl-2-hydroxyethyl bacteriochlorophyllide A dehydrogenase